MSVTTTERLACILEPGILNLAKQVGKKHLVKQIIVTPDVVEAFKNVDGFTSKIVNQIRSAIDNLKEPGTITLYWHDNSD